MVLLHHVPVGHLASHAVDIGEGYLTARASRLVVLRLIYLSLLLLKLALHNSSFLNNLLIIRLVAATARTEFLAPFWVSVYVSDLLLLAVGCSAHVLADLLVESKS